MLLYALTILLSSFLLFQIQPMFAKLILPWFGGGAGVWTVAMLFFQTALLLGYGYAHWSITRLSGRMQLLLHGALLASSLLFLPVSASSRWKPAEAIDPILGISGVLMASIGLPYFLLSSTGPLLQAWYTRRFEGAVPYRLFALSNVGSALALLTYPVLFEPLLPLRTQTRLWSALFCLFAGSCAVTAWLSCWNRVRLPVQSHPDTETEAGTLRPRVVILWALLPACSSMLLLSVTNFLTRDVTPMPFLWVLPLFLYLLTFIICFDADGWYRRTVFLLLLPLAVAGMTVLLRPGAVEFGIRSIIFACSAGFFVCSMVCHGELARLKPPPRLLTAYFLTIAAGGALGGIVVAILAPYLVAIPLELHSALLFCLILAILRVQQDPPAMLSRWPRTRRALAVLPAVLLIFVGVGLRHEFRNSRLVARNFYGSLAVIDRTAGDYPYRILRHGVINHGEQWMEDDLQHDPVTYFCPESGVGQVLTREQDDAPWRVGIVGLGAGTLAAYGHPGDTFRFYEINPLIIDISKTWFTYLSESPARIDVVAGDGRLSLEREPAQNFDLLVVDAFAGDSIPVHLLTREAFAHYFRHLKGTGALAIQATNRYVDLKPLLASLAASFGVTATAVEDQGDEYAVCFVSTWVLIPAPHGHLTLRNGRILTAMARVKPWTDENSNVLQLLK